MHCFEIKVVAYLLVLSPWCGITALPLIFSKDTTCELNEIILEYIDKGIDYSKNIYSFIFIFEDTENCLQELLEDVRHTKIIATASHVVSNSTTFPDLIAANKLLVIFLKRFPISELLKNIPRDSQQALYIIVLTSDSPSPVEIFEFCWQFKIVNVVIVRLHRGAINTYTYFPFSATHCSNGSVLRHLCSVKNGTKIQHCDSPWANKAANLHGCELKLTTLMLKPDVFLKNYTNGTVRIGGIEGRIALTLADRMNFTMSILPVSDGTRWGWKNSKGKLTGLVGDVAYGRSDLGFSQVLRHYDRYKYLDFSTTYKMEYVTWAVPIDAKRPSAYHSLSIEFSSGTWLLIGFVLFISAGILNFLKRNNITDQNLVRDFFGALFFINISFIGAPVVRLPRSVAIRIFYITFLFFSYILSVAYQAALGSIITVPWHTTNIEEIEEILNTNWKITGSKSVSLFLNFSRLEDKIAARIFKRFQIMDTTRALHQLVKHRNLAVMLNNGLLAYYLVTNFTSGGTCGYHILKKFYLVIYPAFVLRKASPYTQQVDTIIQNLFETGFVKHWNDQFSPPVQTVTYVDSGFSLVHLAGAYAVFFSGICTAFVVLLLERFHYCVYNKRFN
ncbi:glutamate [NMDA] receptor subunit 1-like [Periplaneta americana]|uniref:glutamate [NMDA] receptor subunit 1-like n=1 Tax=Periplaneta americana TaxID=6978 RepID=UPI0037E8E798